MWDLAEESQLYAHFLDRQTESGREHRATAVKTLAMPQDQLKGSLIRESASDRFCGFSPSGHLQYNSPEMFNSLLTLLELPSMNILWILHSSQLSANLHWAPFQVMLNSNTSLYNHWPFPRQSFPEPYGCSGPEQPFPALRAIFHTIIIQEMILRPPSS